MTSPTQTQREALKTIMEYYLHDDHYGLEQALDDLQKVVSFAPQSPPPAKAEGLPEGLREKIEGIIVNIDGPGNDAHPAISLDEAMDRIMALATPPAAPAPAQGETSIPEKFIHGFAYALANLIRLHGDCAEARDLFREAGYKMSDFKKAGVEEHDLESMRGLEWIK